MAMKNQQITLVELNASKTSGSGNTSSDLDSGYGGLVITSQHRDGSYDVIVSERVGGGQGKGGFRSRKTRMYPLHVFRMWYVPKDGLWEHYFRCPRCEWERKNPDIAICDYCYSVDKRTGKVKYVQLTEIGCPAFFKREEGGIEVLQLRSDLQGELDRKLTAIANAKDKDLIRKEGGIRVIRIDVD